MTVLAARALWRHLWRRPWQPALLVLGVALGVAVVVAVELANESARRAFALSMQNVAGRATHQIVGGPAGLDETLYVRLRAEAGVRAAPAIEAYGRARGETLHLLGVDPFADAIFRAHLQGLGRSTLARLVSEPNTALLAAPTARRAGVTAGDTLVVTFAGRTHTLTVLGLLASGDAGAAFEGLLVTDIATAQELTATVGRLSWIDLILPEGASGAPQRARIEAMLSPEAALVPAEARGAIHDEMTRAFRTNLTAMSLLALVIGMFLIYNTLTFTVLQRRALIATLRVLGVTRREAFALILAEAAAAGVAGSLLGMAAGAALGQGLVRLVTQTIDDLYFALSVREALLTPGPFVLGLALGVTASLAAALAPAFEAARTRPQLALARSRLETRVRRLAPHAALLGAVMLGASAVVLTLPDRGLVSAFAALFLLTLGLTFMVPLAVIALVRLVDRALPRGAGIPAHLAVRGIAASLSRTGVAIAALMLAVSATVGVGTMIASFRASVEVWLDSTLRADIYVSAPSLRATRTPAATLEPVLLERMRRVPGVAAVAGARYATLESPEGLVELIALELPPEHARSYLFKAGDPQHAWAEFYAGRAVLLTEPYAYRHGLGVGDTLRLRSAHGAVELPVAGVLLDYASEHGLVVMDRTLYQRLFDDPHLSSLRLYLAPDMALAATLEQVRAAAAGEQAVVVRSNRELREQSLAIFDRTFTITHVLRWLAALVAFVGVLAACLALALERAREYALLRAQGLTPGEVRGMVTIQTAFMGLSAGVLALPVGLALALLLIHVVNRRAFGWSMLTVVPAGVLVEAVLIAVLAAMLAGLYPAWRLGRARIAETRREE